MPGSPEPAALTVISEARRPGTDVGAGFGGLHGISHRDGPIRTDFDYMQAVLARPRRARS